MNKKKKPGVLGVLRCTPVASNEKSIKEKKGRQVVRNKNKNRRGLAIVCGRIWGVGDGGGGGRRVRNSSAGVVLRGSSVVAAVLEGRAKIVVVLSHLGQKWFGYGINTTKIPVFRVSIR